MKIKDFFLTLVLSATGMSAFAQKVPFAEEIKAFKHQDSLSMPKPGGLLFIGSSSIRKWDDLAQRFADKPIIRRGVGGSELWQWVKYYGPDLIYPYQAKKIFIYVGENDINSGRSAQTVYDDFVTLYGMIKEHSPKSEIIFMSIKESPSRAKTYAEVLKTDSLIANFLKGKKNTSYVDVNTVLFDSTGRPDSTLFQSDMLHLKSEGYDRWEKAIKKYVK